MNIPRSFSSKDICSLIGTIFTSKSIILPTKSNLTANELRTYLNEYGNTHCICYYYTYNSLIKCMELYGSADHMAFDKELIEEFIVANTNIIMHSHKSTSKILELYEATSLLTIIIERSGYYIDLLATSAMYAILNFKEDILVKILDVYCDSSMRDDFVDGLYRTFSDIHNHRITEIKYHRYMGSFDMVASKLPTYKLSTAAQYSDLINEIYLISLDLSDVIPKKNYILEQIERGVLWSETSRFPRYIEVYFKYPNGKQGDVYRYICEKYGSVTQQDSLSYHAVLYSRYKDKIIPLLCYMSNDTSISQNVCDLFYPYILSHTTYNSSAVYQFKSYKKIVKREIAIHNSFVNRTNELYSKILIEHKASPVWKSEFQLYTVVKQYFPDALYQYHSEWLQSQSLDIFIPSISVGIEYQGKQHFEPVEHFGGRDGYEYTVQRDLKKAELCKKNKITLICWHYSKPISEDTFREELCKYGFDF